MAQSRILITGFEAFNGLDFNPTAHLASKYNNCIYNNCKIETAVLPVSYENCFEFFQSIYNKDYRAIIMCGMAYSRPWWSLEQVAKNLIIDSRPDNNGQIQKEKIQIDKHGANAVYATVNIHNLNQKLKAQGFPSEVSMDAGTYVCNYLYYRVACYYNRPNFFLHIPANKEIKKDSPFSLEDLEVHMKMFLKEVTLLF